MPTFSCLLLDTDDRGTIVEKIVDESVGDTILDLSRLMRIPEIPPPQIIRSAGKPRNNFFVRIANGIRAQELTQFLRVLERE